MRAPERPDNEQQRLSSLYELELLDTDASAIFEGAVELAAQITGCPIALVSLVDAERQWFAAARNLGASETGRDVSFCGHAILSDEVLVVPDARVDARFHDNPLVTDDPNIVFYAGAPLAMPDGTTLGTVCVIDREPRYLSERQVRALANLGQLVTDQLELRRSLLRLERQSAYRIAEQQRQSERLTTVGRDLSTALDGLAGLMHQKLASSTDEETATYLQAALDAAHGIKRLGQSFIDPEQASLDTNSLEISRVDPAEVMQTVLATFRPELLQRNIELDFRLPAKPEILLTDRERFRFLCFHLLGFLLSRPVQGARLTLKLRPDPNSGIEISGYLVSDHPYRAPPGEREDLEMLDKLARSLDANLSTLLDEEQQLQVRVRLPLQI
jgi:signal transduction histidine kinase